ncbi:flavin monoamine oxidase family protein [Roseateles sp.]|jgi:protoporphyrinogen oxidase|uniref:flavin monoamine oxidase family protein n=1 Tax=Roseateles sp. TaxID=1971397 RepID=UPI0037C991E1
MAPQLRRRELLLAAAGLPLAGCEAPPAPLQGGWVGASAARGHRLRQTPPAWSDGPMRRTEVLIVGGGVSGLACARALQAGGIDCALLELEDQAGGNARAHQVGGQPCPLGAHYLPLPGAEAREVQQLLFELGLARTELGRTVFDERHLCHSPQERLFYEGEWVEGLLPPADDLPQRRAQYRRFAMRVNQARRELGFAMPSRHARWTAAHAALDGQTMAQWLRAQQLDEAGLLWYLDYCCRDDYGAGIAEVSAWAGIQYFASRHGFHASGDAEGEREAVLTWPEGNAWLTQRMAQGLPAQLFTGRTVLRVRESRHQVELLAWNEATQAPERWSASQLVLATPLFVALRLLEAVPPALQAAAQEISYAPWLVSNLSLKSALLDRPGVGPAWDSVAYGSPALGYVDARHQTLDPTPRPGLITHYWALPRQQRATLLGDDWAVWAQAVIAELAHTHADLPQQLQRIDLARWGHAMSIPTPGVRGSAALAALREQQQGRLHFAHSDVAGYSVFEEAFTQGATVAARLAREVQSPRRKS